MPKSAKGKLQLLAAGASLANGAWASMAQGAGQSRGSAGSVLMAVAAVWVGYLSLSWLFRGMRS